MGAKIGHDLAIGSITIRQPHLLTLGDGTNIGSAVNLENVRIERGEMIVGSITLGAEAHVGSCTVLQGEVSIAEHGRLEGQSSLSAGLDDDMKHARPAGIRCQLKTGLAAQGHRCGTDGSKPCMLNFAPCSGTDSLPLKDCHAAHFHQW